MNSLVCGVDVGTSAARAMVCDLSGAVRSAGARDLLPPAVQGNRREQDPEDWWTAVCAALRQALAGQPADQVRAVAVDATSGTIMLADADLRPLGPGLMYNDGRAAGYAERINAVAGDFIRRHGYRFKDDFSLSKILWLQEHAPRFATVRHVLHQSDFINVRLTGGSVATDWSNALKSGCDLHAAAWPDFIFDSLGVSRTLLPNPVVPPGTLLGTVSAAAAAATGLRAGTAVVAGASDGTASLIASGATQPGEFNTALGSTLTIKGVAPHLVHDPDGVIYSHRHPSGYWLPGGASNVGCAALNRAFAPAPATRTAQLRRLDDQAAAFLPAAIDVYPLGDLTEERFPFKRSGIQEFVAPPTPAGPELYAAYLQGSAHVERWCYEKLAALGAKADRIYSTGGGSRSRLWNQLRADVLQRPLVLPEQTETAFGAAVLAAAHLCGSVEAAGQRMTRTAGVVEPGAAIYDEPYERFRAECRRRWGV